MGKKEKEQAHCVKYFWKEDNDMQNNQNTIIIANFPDRWTVREGVSINLDNY